MTTIKLTNKEKIEILKQIHNTHRNEITHHREMQFRIFSWTTSLLLAIAASLFAFVTEWAKYRLIGTPFLTITTLVFLSTTILILRRNAKALETNARTVIRIDKILCLFDESEYLTKESVYPKAWLLWGTSKYRASVETWFYAITTIILGGALITVSWLLT